MKQFDFAQRVVASHPRLTSNGDFYYGFSLTKSDSNVNVLFDYGDRHQFNINDRQLRIYAVDQSDGMREPISARPWQPARLSPLALFRETQPIEFQDPLPLARIMAYFLLLHFFPKMHLPPIEIDDINRVAGGFLPPRQGIETEYSELQRYGTLYISLGRHLCARHLLETMAHELVHVWQYQNARLPINSMHAHNQMFWRKIDAINGALQINASEEMNTPTILLVKCATGWFAGFTMSDEKRSNSAIARWLQTTHKHRVETWLLTCLHRDYTFLIQNLPLLTGQDIQYALKPIDEQHASTILQHNHCLYHT